MTEQQVTVRSAIYTRKSTEEGLEQELNTLQAQREGAKSCSARCSTPRGSEDLHLYPG